MKQGKFIVIDGSDGSGKKTQSDLLIKNLKSEGYKIAFYDFPQYEKSFFGCMVGRYLNGEFGEADEVSPYLSSILYAGDRFEASRKIKQDIKAGKIVIANRYIQSNMAFQTAKLKHKAEKKKFLHWVQEMEHEVFEIPRADLVIYLSLPYQISQALVDKKETRAYTKHKRDIHEKNSNFLARVEEEYHTLAKTNSEWRLIECMNDSAIASREEISQKIFTLVKKELETK